LLDPPRAKTANTAAIRSQALTITALRSQLKDRMRIGAGRAEALARPLERVGCRSPVSKPDRQG